MKTNATKFRLIGNQTIFVCKAQWLNKVGTRCVLGITLDGKFQTVARLEDVIKL